MVIVSGIVARYLLSIGSSRSHCSPPLPRAASSGSVYFEGADGPTEIAGYLFKPATPPPHRAAARRSGPRYANGSRPPS
jgi:hypothetical protein